MNGVNTEEVDVQAKQWWWGTNRQNLSIIHEHNHDGDACYPWEILLEQDRNLVTRKLDKGDDELASRCVSLEGNIIIVACKIIEESF